MTASVTGDGLVSARINPEARVISLVIPTFNESANVVELLAQLDAALPARAPCEVIFVDDSTDDTPAVDHRGRQRTQRHDGASASSGARRSASAARS